MITLFFSSPGLKMNLPLNVDMAFTENYCIRGFYTLNHRCDLITAVSTGHFSGYDLLIHVLQMCCHVDFSLPYL